jgi:AcrR family transcriptional regulator
MSGTAESGGDRTEDRRQRILEAALQEFAGRGYERASTNAITEAAGLSKGLLFHYFSSKKGLYLAALRNCVEHSAAWNARDRERERPLGDLIERLLQNGLRKLRYTIEHPVRTRIVLDAFASPPDGLRAEIEALGESYRPLVTDLFTKDLDLKVFRDGVSVAKAVEVVMIFLDGLRARFAKPGMTDPEAFDRVFQEARDYFEILKYGIYRPKG